MLTSLASRLPGVYFETASVRPPDELPRMDVAAFVGFAASGPLHTPVPIESVSRFREIFGPDVRLAWDEERGAFEHAWLGAAVDAFFGQGGRRCWVVRVADAQTAMTLPFPIPGVVDAAGEPAIAVARAPGSWPVAGAGAGATESALALGTVLVRERFPVRAGGGALSFDAAAWRLELEQTPRTLRRGDLLEVSLDAPNLILFLFVRHAEAMGGHLTVEGESAFWFDAPAAASPPAREAQPFGAENPDLRRLTAGAVAGLEHAAQASSALEPSAVHRLTFDLLSWRGARVEHRLNGLAFSRHHPRFWASLPSDAELFETSVGRPLRTLTPEETLLRADANAPRFPFAGPTDAASTYLPIGMTTHPSRQAARTADVAGGLSALAMDGLEVFDDRLFLDAELARVHAGSLLAEAEGRHSFQRGLRGLHSLFPVQEVSLIAVPDATHRAWNRVPPASAPRLDAPRLHAVGPLDAHGRAVLTWTPVAEATGYRLEAARCRTFSTPTVVRTGGTATTAPFALPDDCPAVWHFRVRAERRGEVSTWSNGRAAMLPPIVFEACGALRPGIADLVLTAAPSGSPPLDPGLTWDYEDPADAQAEDRFDLQRSFEPGFDAPERVDLDAEGFDATGTGYLPPAHGAAVRYYRVRVVRDGQKGAWSNTVSMAPTERAAFTLLPQAEYEPGALLAVQRALMRFCAARADAVALFSLPRVFHEDQVAAHLGQLLPQTGGLGSTAPSPTGALRVPALTRGEEAILSYGALYHPWIATTTIEATAESRRFAVMWQPPDGHAAGAIAARTLRLGAWVAPANDVLSAVVSLDPLFPREVWARLTDAQVNLVVADARGFVVFNADTLSRTDSLRPLNVRRLMILLRRLALREGATFVFEPHGEDFRGLVRQRFERLLSNLYLRGAFAGATPPAGFRVVVDESVNPPRLMEVGRFLVELRVAPSQPFRYLTVRLEQASPERLTVTEA
jgi:hypothetical protein